MRNPVLAAIAALALASQAAAAAELRTPWQTGSTGWQGPYVGASVGYQWGDVSNSGARPGGIGGGIQGGYNWQTGRYVFGAEADLQFSDADDTFASWKFSNPWFGTVRGRVGVALDNVLLYGTLGLAYGTLIAQSTAAGLTESKLEVGWAGGAGLEVALMGGWSARAEYLYVDLGERNFAFTGTSHGIASSYLRMGINYRF